MKLGARNALKGTVVEIKKGSTTAHVRIDIGSAIVMASITNDAVDDPGLKVGSAATAIIKSPDVLVAVDSVKRPRAPSLHCPPSA